MASVSKRPNGTRRARYRDPVGKEHARHFTRKVHAQRWLDEVTTSLITGVYVDPAAGNVTFGDYWHRLVGAPDLDEVDDRHGGAVGTVHDVLEPAAGSPEAGPR